MTYDDIADYYVRFVDEALGNRNSILAQAHYGVLHRAGDVSGLVVCDMACGTGIMAATLAKTAQQVTGTDISANFIAMADRRFQQNNLRFIHDDAQTLNKQGDAHYDLVVSNMALMDIPDLSATLNAVHSVLKDKGRFVFSITHPCFQSPHAGRVDIENGAVWQIYRYATEGKWHSQYPNGIRGQVGAHHRTLSTYINTLINAGFMVENIDEPVSKTVNKEIPAVMIISTKKTR